MKQVMSRREAMAAMGAVTVAACTSRIAEAKEKKSTEGIALQLYTMREPAKKDLPGTLKKCREIGWEYVQWSGMPDLSAEEIRKALDAAGLKAIAAHTSVESFEQDFDAAVKFWKTVGNTNVAPGGMMGDCKDTLEAWKRGAKRMDEVGAKLRGVGMRLSYHNHAGEFEKFPEDPRCKLDILMDETKPENLCAELDVAWVLAGDADPAAYIRKYKNRCVDIHVKDLATVKPVKFAPIGKGILDWKDIFAAGREAKVEWYIYEQDNCYGDPFAAAKISFDFMSKHLL